VFDISRQGSVHIVAVETPLTGEVAEPAGKALARCLEQGPPRIVVDMQATPLLDSRGLEMLVDSAETSAARGGSLVLAAPNALCRDILSVTGLDADFAIFDDVITAVGSFAL
jgi:anti-sigma B factor antagonist